MDQISGYVTSWDVWHSSKHLRNSITTGVGLLPWTTCMGNCYPTILSNHTTTCYALATGTARTTRTFCSWKTQMSNVSFHILLGKLEASLSNQNQDPPATTSPIQYQHTLGVFRVTLDPSEISDKFPNLLILISILNGICDLQGSWPQVVELVENHSTRSTARRNHGETHGFFLGGISFGGGGGFEGPTKWTQSNLPSHLHTSDFLEAQTRVKPASLSVQSPHPIQKTIFLEYGLFKNHAFCLTDFSFSDFTNRMLNKKRNQQKKTINFHCNFQSSQKPLVVWVWHVGNHHPSILGIVIPP